MTAGVLSPLAVILGVNENLTSTFFCTKTRRVYISWDLIVKLEGRSPR